MTGNTVVTESLQRETIRCRGQAAEDERMAAGFIVAEITPGGAPDFLGSLTNEPTAAKTASQLADKHPGRKFGVFAVASTFSKECV